MPTKVYVTRDNLASIRCPECSRQKTIDTSKFTQYHKAVMVKCTCGAAFPIIFEKRKYYRKLVNFVGHYATPEAPGEYKPITIEDISRTGIRFRTNMRHDLAPGQTILVTFVLDDKNRTPMELKIKVRRVQGLEVGGEFPDNIIPKALAFYLLP